MGPNNNILTWDEKQLQKRVCCPLSSTKSWNVTSEGNWDPAEGTTWMSPAPSHYFVRGKFLPSPPGWNWLVCLWWWVALLLAHLADTSIPEILYLDIPMTLKVYLWWSRREKRHVWMDTGPSSLHVQGKMCNFHPHSLHNKLRVSTSKSYSWCHWYNNDWHYLQIPRMPNNSASVYSRKKSTTKLKEQVALLAELGLQLESLPYAEQGCHCMALREK